MMRQYCEEVGYYGRCSFGFSLIEYYMFNEMLLWNVSINFVWYIVDVLYLRVNEWMFIGSW